MDWKATLPWFVTRLCDEMMQYFVLVHTPQWGWGGVLMTEGLTMLRSGDHIPCSQSIPLAVAVDRDVSLRALYRHRRLFYPLETKSIWTLEDVLKSQTLRQWGFGSQTPSSNLTGLDAARKMQQMSAFSPKQPGMLSWLSQRPACAPGWYSDSGRTGCTS